MSDKVCFDINVLLYLLSDDIAKADKAEALLTRGGIVSVQVLNDATSVCLHKLRMSWIEVDTLIATIRAYCQVEALTEATFDAGWHLAQRYRLSIYDSMSVAAALLAGAHTLYSENLHGGLHVERRLVVRNPFLG